MCRQRRHTARGAGAVGSTLQHAAPRCNTRQPLLQCEIIMMMISPALHCNTRHHTHTHTQTHTISHTHTLSLSHTHTRTYTLSHIRTHTPTRTPTHTNTHNTHTQTLTHTHTHSLPLYLTHTSTHTTSAYTQLPLVLPRALQPLKHILLHLAHLLPMSRTFSPSLLLSPSSCTRTCVLLRVRMRQWACVYIYTRGYKCIGTVQYNTYTTHQQSFVHCHARVHMRMSAGVYVVRMSSSAEVYMRVHAQMCRIDIDKYI